LSFDGVDDLFTVNEDFFYGKSFTFSCWVNDTDSKGEISEPANRWIFAHGTANTNKLLHFGYRRWGTYGLLFGFYGNDLNTEFTASTGWSFLSFTFDYPTKSRKIFANGNVIGSDVSPSNYLGTGNFHLGRVFTSDFFTLEIDDLRIYDRALSALEVKALYELGEEPVQESGAGTTTVVNGTVADGSITTNQLSEQILKYLKPEITQQPTAGTIFADTNHTISVSAEGKYLTYQWKKNGVNLTGETNATLTITDANASQHDGNYSVVVSNDFGSVESGDLEIQISDSLMNGLVAWWKFDETEGTIAYDSSGNGNDGNLTNGPTWVTGKIGGALSFDGIDDLVNFPITSYPIGQYANVSFWAFGGTNLPQNTFLFSAINSSSNHLFNVHMTWETNFTIFYDFGNSSTHNRIQKAGVSSDFKGSWQFWNLSKNTPNGTMSIHKNGQVWHTENEKNSELATIDELEFFKIGNKYHGLVDDVRIYNRVLSTSEILSLYQLGQ
jgi:hypothetical protein